jgi:hypothetical protein
LSLSVKSIVVEFGVLRVVLILAALFSLIFRPVPVLDPTYVGWNMVTYLLLPVLAPIQFMLHMLDSLMGLVMMADKTGAARARYRRIALTQAVIALALLAYWVPYFIAINAKP